MGSKVMGYQAFFGMSWMLLFFSINISLISRPLDIYVKDWDLEDWSSSLYMELWMKTCLLQAPNSRRTASSNSQFKL